MNIALWEFLGGRILGRGYGQLINGIDSNLRKTQQEKEIQKTLPGPYPKVLVGHLGRGNHLEIRRDVFTCQIRLSWTKIDDLTGIGNISPIISVLIYMCTYLCVCAIF